VWTTADELRFTVLMGLRAGLKRCRGMRRALTEDEQEKVARIIVEEIASQNWRVERGPPETGASHLIGHAPATLLKSDAQKERYESLLMFAFRKLQAARYHRQRVERLVHAQRKNVQLAAKSKPGSDEAKVLTATVRTSRSANEFAFELCAFFAALRSAIDFLARTCALHLKGVEADSVTTLIGVAKKKANHGRLLDIIAREEAWLLRLRDYRDYLLHRIVLTTTTGGHVEWKAGEAVTTTFPVVVPADTPKHVPDTRRARALDEPESRFNVSTSEASMTYADGNKTIVERRIEIEPETGYVRIEELMTKELSAFEDFFVSILEALTVLNFGFDQPK
jgi:hypothetical protein